MIKDEWHMLTDWQMLAEIDEEEERKILAEWPCQKDKDYYYVSSIQSMRKTFKSEELWKQMMMNLVLSPE